MKSISAINPAIAKKYGKSLGNVFLIPQYEKAITS